LALSEEEKAWLAAHPVIRVGIDPEWPPYEFLDGQGRHQGISADYLQLVAERLGVRFVVGPRQPWSTTWRQLTQGALDITPPSPKPRSDVSSCSSRALTCGFRW
jgi:ABC-type amino acid transport substrate-binding protein